MEMSIDIIEQLNQLFIKEREASNAYAWINDAMHDIVERKIDHEPGCEADPRKYPTNRPFDCPACELLAIARYVNDFEELPDLELLRFVTQDTQRLAKNSHTY